MADPRDLYAAISTITYGSVHDLDSIATSTATVASAVSLSGSALDGAIGAGRINFPQTIAITTTSAVGAYSASNVAAFGTYKGASVADSFALTLTGGNQTVKGSQAFDYVTQVNLPAMAASTGFIKVGTYHIVLDPPARELRGGSTGNLAVEYMADETGTPSDSIPCVAGEHHKVLATKIDADNTTALPVTIYR